MPDDFGSGLDVGAGGGVTAPGFGSAIAGVFGGPRYTVDPNAAPLDQAADQLQQRITRAGQVSVNPWAQIFAPDRVKSAREFVPQATEQLQKIQTQRQQQTDIQKAALNFGMPASAINPYMTNDTVDNWLLDRYKSGDFGAAKSLQARGKGEWVQDFAAAAADGAGKKLKAADTAATKLNAAGNNQSTYDAVRKNLTPEDKQALTDMGLQSIPDTPAKWQGLVAKYGAVFAQTQQLHSQIMQKINNMTSFDQTSPKEVGESIAANVTLGNTNEPAFEGKNVKTRSMDGQPGIVAPNGSVRTDLYGRSSKDGGWNAWNPEREKTFQEYTKDENVKGAINQYSMMHKVHDTMHNEKNYTSAAGLTAIKDELGTMRDVAEKSAAAGSIGFTKMFGLSQGTVESFLNRAAQEHAAVQDWMRSGKKPEDAPPSKRMSEQTIRGLKELSQHMLEYASNEAKGRLGGAMTYAGRGGKPLDEIPLDAALKKELEPLHEAGRQEAINTYNSHPSLISGNQRVFFPQGSNVPGANPPRMPPGSNALSPGAIQPPGGTPPGPSSTLPGAGPGGTPSAGPPGGGTPVANGNGLQPAVAPSGPPGGGPPSAPSGTPVVPPVGGTTPGRGGLPPGMPLNSEAAFDALANREIQLESGFKLGSKTGSYVGLGQWSAEEMKRHGITNPDDLEQNRAALKADAQRRAAKLQKDGLPVTAANVYLMHNQGEAGLEAHLRNPDELAWKNVRFGYKNDATAKAAIWGNMTPEMRRQFTERGGVNAVTSGDFTRLWEARVNNTDAGGKFAGARDERTDPSLASYGRKHPRFEEPADPDSFWERLKRGDIPGGRKTTEDARKNFGPAVGSTIGSAVGGAVGGPPGFLVGGGVGGGAGQALQDYVAKRPQNPTEIAKQTALGTVLGIVPEGRPIAGFAARTLGAGAVEAGGKAAEGGDTADVLEAGARGTAGALGGEAFGRALGMVGHKVWKMFSPDAKQAVIDAAKAHSDAEQVLRTEQPKLLNAAGASSGPNPKYAAAEAAKEKAETTLKDAGLNPEEAAYAHRAASEGVPRQEAVVNRPGDIEKRALGAGYNELEQELPPRKGMKAAVTASTEPLANGPLVAFKNGDVVKSKVNEELANHVENAITAPAKTWAEKWTQLREARTDLLQAERDAMTSTAAGRTQTAKDMRTFADTVRTQQEKVAEYVFGKRDGAAFIDRLKVLDTRYAKLMDATNGGDIAKAVAMKGEAGREAEKRFMAFAAGDPEAQRAYRAMRGVDPTAFEATVPWTVAAEGIPIIGKGIKLVKMAGMLSEYATRKAAGDPVKFRDLVKLPHDDNGRLIRNVAGTAGARAAVSATESPVQGGEGAAPFSMTDVNNFAHGGILGVMQGRGTELPEWIKSAGNVLRHPDVQTALGVIGPAGVVRMGEMIAAGMTQRQIATELKASLGDVQRTIRKEGLPTNPNRGAPTKKVGEFTSPELGIDKLVKALFKAQSRPSAP